MKAVVAAVNQEKALVGAFSVITNLRMELFEALVINNVLLTSSQYWAFYLLDIFAGYIASFTLSINIHWAEQ